MPIDGAAPHLSAEERALLLKIAAPDGLLMAKPHLDWAIQRFGAIGLIYAVPVDHQMTRLRLTPVGRKLVDEWQD